MFTHEKKRIAYNWISSSTDPVDCCFNPDRESPFGGYLSETNRFSFSDESFKEGKQNQEHVPEGMP
jgi:hypothetical protein